MTTYNPPPAPPNPQIISYQKLRAFIGIIGILLPILVVLGCLLFGDKRFSFQPSISHYYYSNMHIIFVGTLCVLGGFLITYKGNADNIWESRVSNLAGFCAFAVASFPTQFCGFKLGPNNFNRYITLSRDVTCFRERLITYLQVFCSAVLCFSV